MKQTCTLLSLIVTLGIWTSCSNNTNTNTVNENSPPTENNATTSSIPEEVNSNPQIIESPQTPEETASKTDAEVVLEAAQLALNGISDIAEILRIKDSIRQANKEKMFAYVIGVQMKEKEALKAYKNLTDAKISSIYIFKAGRKEYYTIKFDAKGEEELAASLEEFKTQLGENGAEGVRIKNLTDFCSKRETIIKDNMSENGVEIKSLKCN